LQVFSSVFGNVATVLLVLVSIVLFLHIISDALDDGEIRPQCVEHWMLSESLCIHKFHWIITINVWKCKLVFPTETLQQNI